MKYVIVIGSKSISVTPAACMKLRFTYIFMKLTCIVEKLATLEVQAYVR